jgi:hypothetical protein
MELVVVGAGVGRTGTHSLKVALEQLLNAPCHHMLEILGDPTQIPAWTDAIEGRPVDWPTVLSAYRAIVDWPGGSFWPRGTTTPSAPKYQPTGSSNGHPATDGNPSANGSGSPYQPKHSPSPTPPTSSAKWSAYHHSRETHAALRGSLIQCRAP